MTCGPNDRCKRAHDAQLMTRDDDERGYGKEPAAVQRTRARSDMSEGERTALCATTPIAFIGRYCSRLGLNEELTDLCKFVAIRIHLHDLVPENTPHSIAAGVLFFICQACNQPVTKSQVHSVSEISEVTVNKCFRKLEAIRDDLLPPSVVTKYALPD